MQLHHKINAMNEEHKETRITVVTEKMKRIKIVYMNVHTGVRMLSTDKLLLS